MVQVERTRCYFVDESGDPLVFSKRSRVAFNKPGCARYFILGFLDIPDPTSLARELRELRERLKKDPYFTGVPSFQGERQKTALSFHAKDDLPEVRRQVYDALVKYPMKFHAVVRDKRDVLSSALQRRESEPSFRYHANDLYDSLVRRLFKDHLHKAELHRICFARRGKSDRTMALREALIRARERFCTQWNREQVGQIIITAEASKDNPCLQAVDYFLWALQRVYVRGEDRYIRYIWDSVGLIHDVDDRREASYGAYYHKNRPLRAAAIKRNHGI